MVCAYTLLPHVQGDPLLVHRQTQALQDYLQGSWFNKDGRNGLGMEFPSRDPLKSTCNPTNTSEK